MEKDEIGGTEEGREGSKVRENCGVEEIVE